MSHKHRALVIVSGGQTGADRAALDFALRHGFPHRGWCPAGRLTEDGQLDACYRLSETPSPAYTQRTEWNVRDSDGTVIFASQPHLTGGSLLTMQFARQLGKPLLVLVRGQPPPPAQTLRAFIQKHRIRALNVAGPRASFAPHIAAFVKTVLEEALLARAPARAARRPGRRPES